MLPAGITSQSLIERTLFLPTPRRATASSAEKMSGRSRSPSSPFLSQPYRNTKVSWPENVPCVEAARGAGEVAEELSIIGAVTIRQSPSEFLPSILGEKGGTCLPSRVLPTVPAPFYGLEPSVFALTLIHTLGVEMSRALSVGRARLNAPLMRSGERKPLSEIQRARQAAPLHFTERAEPAQFRRMGRVGSSPRRLPAIVSPHFPNRLLPAGPSLRCSPAASWLRLELSGTHAALAARQDSR